MSTVMYGRREGQQRNNNFTKDLPRVGFMAQGINPRDVAVLQPRDWQRIQNNLTRYNGEAEKQEAQKREREELHATSKDLVKHWGNTIEGQRLKKLQARKLREEQDELERQKFDKEEAKLQAEKRKEAIKRAKQLQYYETDRVKGFHGALLLTEVLKERDAQIEMKHAKQGWQKGREDNALALQKKNNEEAIRADMEKANARFDQACAVSNFQLLQVKDRDCSAIEEKQTDIEEANTIKEQCEVFLAAKKTIDTHNRYCKTVLKDTYKNEINLKKERENQEKLKDEVKNAQIRKFVHAKRKMATMRKEKEQELFEAFQDHTEKMRDKLLQEMQRKVDDEDERIARAVAAQEKKRTDIENRKEKVQKETLGLIKDHRLQMISGAEKIRQDNLKKDKSLLIQRIKEDQNFQRSVTVQKSKQRSKAAEFQTTHKVQMTEKRDNTNRKKKEQLHLDKKNTELLVQEEEIFQAYANKVIDDAKQGQRNPFPLIKAKMEGPGGGRGPKFEGNAGLRPSYIVADATGVQLPHYVKDEIVYNQTYGHVGKSGKRIGFSW